MLRTLISCGILLAVAAPMSAAPAPEKEPTPVLATAKKLARPVRFPGYERDERMTLRDALDRLTELYGLRFGINDLAFRSDASPILEVLNIPTVDRQPLPPMENVPLETVLRRLLERVPVASGATFTIRRGEIEITTGRAQQVEFWGENYAGPFLPLVHTSIEKRPLEDVLKELADATDYNIVVDSAAAEKAKTPVTARLLNVPLDTAVRLLANMADLKPFLVDNVLYVTTREGCARLEAEEKAKRRQKGAMVPGLPQLPPGPRVGNGRTPLLSPPSPLLP